MEPVLPRELSVSNLQRPPISILSLRLVASGANSSSPSSMRARETALVDYTAYPTEEELIKAIQEAVKKGGAPDGRCWKAFDSVSEDDTVRLVTKAIAGPPDAAGRRPKVTNIFLKTDVEGSDPSVDVVFSMVGQVHYEDENDKLIGITWGAAFARGPREGWLIGHPYTFGKNGLGGLSEGLKGLKDGKIRAQKFLTRLSETSGASDGR